MRKMIVIVGVSLFLGACVAPEPYDAGAISVGLAQQSAAQDMCYARGRAKEFRTVSDFANCLSAAKAEFVTAIHLTLPKLYLAYESRMETLGEEADRGTVNYAQFNTRLLQIEKDFDDELVAAYQENRQERAQQMANAAAFSAALQQAAKNFQEAGQPVYPVAPGVNCTSIQNGVFTNTHCN